MRTTLALCFLLTAAEPALARCHAIWRYPWPQNCRTASAPVHHRTWFVEIAPKALPAPPPAPAASTEDAERAAALDQLRMELRERAVSAIELSTTGLTRVEEPK